MPSKLEYSLSAVNVRLAIARLPVRVHLRDGRIWVKTTFPTKPGSDRPPSYQQRFALGLPASEHGFRKAEKEAKLIAAELVISVGEVSPPRSIA